MIVKVPLTNKEMRAFPGRRFKYVDRTTGRIVVFLQGTPGSQRTMPDYVFRYLKPAPSQYDKDLAGIQFIPGKSQKQSKKRGSNYTAPKRISIQKRIA